jgi:hypothetical protein
MPVRDEKGRWTKGHSGNPAGGPGKRGKVPEAIMKLVQANTSEAIKKIIELMNGASSDSIRLEAAKYIIDRGLGRDFTAFEPMDEADHEPFEIRVVRASNPLEK